MTIPVVIYRQSLRTRMLRRCCDVVLASILLFLAAPVLVLAAISIGLDDGFPILFKQRRAGRFERTFVILKLRTMKRSACGDKIKPLHGSDDRITRVGRFLRRTSIDELPQLFNVLRGDMSIVGPRPEMPFIVKRYERWQHLRHLISPGITCIWQAEKRSIVPLESCEATLMDLEYIRRASLRFDGALLIRTVGAVISTRGAV